MGLIEKLLRMEHNVFGDYKLRAGNIRKQLEESVGNATYSSRL